MISAKRHVPIGYSITEVPFAQNTISCISILYKGKTGITTETDEKNKRISSVSGIREPIIIEIIAVGQDQGEYALLNQKTGR